MILAFSLRSIAAGLVLSLLAVASVETQSRVVELNEAGWKAIGRADGTRAASLFGEALVISPADPVLLLGAGAAAHLQGKTDLAIKRLKESLTNNPRLVQASRMLGAIAYSAGDIELAIRTYEQALRHAPHDHELAAELAEWREEAEVHRGFEERRYDRFNVMFHGRQDEPLAAEATGHLTSAFWRIGQKLGAYPANPVVVVLYTEQQFRDITRAPEWSNGQYDGRIRVPVAGASRKGPAFAKVLTHELTHAMVASLAPSGVPGWLHEGIAQFFDGEDVAAARRRLQVHGRPVSLQLLEGSFAGLNAAQAALAYDQSLVAASVLFERPDFGWSRLLADLAEGEPFALAITRFGFSYEDLDDAVRR